MSKSKPPNSLSSPSPSPSPSPSQFSHTVTKIAVAQILKSIGFKSSKTSALETLTRITTLFLQSLSKTASSHAAFCCRRTQCNVFDVVYAIEQSLLPFGFSGASNVNQSLLQSKTLIDLDYFFDEIDELPLLWNRRLRNFDSFSSVFFSGKVDINNDNNSSRGLEIPRWLPEFPRLNDVKVNDVSVNVNVNDEKGLWEDTRLVCRPLMAEKRANGKKEMVLKGRRDRIKFKVLGKRKDMDVGGLDDLELRNGVCIGGKRVCLSKRIGNCSTFFQQDDDDDENR